VGAKVNGFKFRVHFGWFEAVDLQKYFISPRTVDFVAAETSISQQTASRGKYIKYTAQDRFNIGKYASEICCVR